jgi:hypothetical protein
VAVGRAQGAPGFHIGVAGGALLPTGDQHDVLDTGWNATLLFPINFGASPFGIRFDGSYGELTTKSDLVGFLGDGKSRIISGTFDFVVGPHFGAVQPYFIGGVGAYDLRFTGQEVDTGNLFADSSTRFGWNAAPASRFASDNQHPDLRPGPPYEHLARLTGSPTASTGGHRFTLIPVNIVIF